jgi:tRNA threonylcarbamoyladenosine biosynthesis protein TsaE
MVVGKTTLVKCIAEQLGVSNSISSPTYSIVNEHTTKEGLLYHFDLYRINNIEELYDFGIEDYLYTNNWIIIEWPEIAEPLLPDAYNTICISEISETQRLLKLITKE